MDSEQNFKKQSNKGLLWAMFALAVLGFADTAYLTIVHFLNRVPPCRVLQGCETVLTSKFSTIGPIPLSLIGAGFYVIIFILLFWYQQTAESQTRKILKAFVIAGFLFSLMLLYIQAFILHAYCYYCLTSLGTSTLLFLFSFAL